jgi:predicted  nucleic acid-binding Zn-ribbon protein
MSHVDSISLDCIARQQSQLLDELRLLRQESRDIRKAFTGISEHFSRQERRIGDLRDDLEGMIKLELGGAVANLETRLEIYLDRRLGEIDQKLDAIIQAVKSD